MNLQGGQAATTQGGIDLSTWIDALGEGVYGIDLHGNCLFVNASALRVLRYDDAAELIGRDMHHAIHHTRSDGTHFPAGECPLVHTSRSGRPVQLENETLWRRDGTSFLAEYSAFPVTRSGAIVGSVVTFRETTIRRDAAVRLAVQHAVSQVVGGTGSVESMMRGVLETIGRGFGWNEGLFWSRRHDPSVTGHDAHARIEPFPAACWALHPRAEPPASSSPASSSPTSPGLALRAWRSGEPLHVPDLAAIAAVPDSDAAAIRRDEPRGGVAVPVALGDTRLGAIEFYAGAPFEADDSLLEALRVMGQMIGQGIERRRAAAALRASETRFRVIADTNPQLSWMADATGDMTWYNQRWYDFTGATFDQMAGWGWKALHHPDHIARVENSFRASLETGEEWEDTFPLLARDGAYRWFLSRAVPIRAEPDARGDTPIVAWFGTNTDITAMRMAEESQAAALDEAEAASQAKSLFLANMSHELRTPLSAIIGYAEMLTEEVQDGAGPDEIVRDLGKVEANARHLLGLINDVLDLSKVESGKMEIYAEPFDIAAMLREVAATVATLVDKKGNTLDLEVAPDIGAMHSDVTRIRQILLNLLSNAAKFTQSGRITLTATRHHPDDGPGPETDHGTDTGRIVFTVADTGLGMSPDQLGKLFERFQQADASTTRKFGGTGLGLSLTRSFAHMLGGDVAVTSQTGVGSVFTVTVPAMLPAPSVPEPSDLAPQGEGAGRDVVLVIDDDLMQCELMARQLDRIGFAPRIVTDGPTGLALARELRPHAILLDVTMPGMDGWSVLTALKSEPELAAIPVVMVTVQNENPLAQSLGAADYLVKPVDWNRLRVVMDGFRGAEGDILIVEDDPDTRRRTRRLLEANDWTVSEAADGQEALDLVAHAPPRLILLDLTMPGMDGFEFLRRLRERPACRTVPVVVLTALDLTMDDRRRLRGATQVLSKGSTSLNELMEKLHAIDTPPQQASL